MQEQRMRSNIQAIHAQSPRTVQRNLDQITSDIKNTCDLRKSLNFKYSVDQDVENTDVEKSKIDIMDYEPIVPEESAFKQPVEQPNYQQMQLKPFVQEEVEEEEIQIDFSGDINPFDRTLIGKFLKKMKFPLSQHCEGYYRIDSLGKLVPSSTVRLGMNFLIL